MLPGRTAARRGVLYMLFFFCTISFVLAMDTWLLDLRCQYNGRLSTHAAHLEKIKNETNDISSKKAVRADVSLPH